MCSSRAQRTYVIREPFTQSTFGVFAANVNRKYQDRAGLLYRAITTTTSQQFLHRFVNLIQVAGFDKVNKTRRSLNIILK